MNTSSPHAPTQSEGKIVRLLIAAALFQWRELTKEVIALYVQSEDDARTPDEEEYLELLDRAFHIAAMRRLAGRLLAEPPVSTSEVLIDSMFTAAAVNAWAEVSTEIWEQLPNETLEELGQMLASGIRKQLEKQPNILCDKEIAQQLRFCAWQSISKIIGAQDEVAQRVATKQGLHFLLNRIIVIPQLMLIAADNFAAPSGEATHAEDLPALIATVRDYSPIPRMYWYPLLAGSRFDPRTERANLQRRQEELLVQLEKVLQ